MTVERKSDRTPRQSLREHDKQRSVRRFVATATIVILLAGAAVYTLTFRTIPALQPTEQTDDSRTRNAEPHDLPDPETSEPEHRRRSSEFVGSRTCAECHSDIAETYSAHPMANTLALVADASPDQIVEGDSTEFEAQGCRYRVERSGDRMIHTEFLADADGKLVYEQSEDVHYAVGSGTSAKTYLIDRGGIMFESPITWYADKRKWDLSPGYKDNPRQRFNRRVSDGCVQCHSGHAAFTGDGTSNRFEEQPFLELGIGCERCHGPGKRHVEKLAADDWDAHNETVEDMLIVNPARLDRHLEDSVCYQCHMDGKHRILRKGKSFHDFRPGMATEDIWTVFVSHEPSEADGTAPFTSQVEQMHSSACFRGSDGQMSCTSCHDPHRSPEPDERAAFYRERCNSCHSDHGCLLPIEEREAPPALNSCVHCHMPMASSSDIPHTSHSDHRVLREPHSNQDVVDRSNQREVWSIFDDSDQRVPQREVQRARALALFEQAVEDLDQRLMGQAVVALEAVSARDANDVSVLRSLGFLYGLARNSAKSMSSYEAALRASPRDEMSLKNLGLMGLRTRSLDVARRSYEEYLEVNKWDATMYEPYVRILAASGHLQAALEAAERGLRLDPTQRGLRGTAAKLHGRIGSEKKSLQHREILEVINNQLEPWDQKRRDRRQKQVQERVQRN